MHTRERRELAEIDGIEACEVLLSNFTEREVKVKPPHNRKNNNRSNTGESVKRLYCPQEAINEFFSGLGYNMDYYIKESKECADDLYNRRHVFTDADNKSQEKYEDLWQSVTKLKNILETQ